MLGVPARITTLPIVHMQPERKLQQSGMRINCQCYEYIDRALYDSIILILQMGSRSKHALVSVSVGGNRRTAAPGIVLDLSPRIVLFLDWLASFGTIPGNLQERLNTSRSRSSQTTKKGQTHMTVLFALVARLHRGLRAIHVFHDRVRRCQAVTGTTRRNQSAPGRLARSGKE